jgi:DNA transformation protein
LDADSIRDDFQELGPVRIRRMFGGQGIYAGERMFALEAGGEVYLKVDNASRDAFEAAGSRPFVHEAKGKTMTINYWLMPGEGLDDPSEAARWGRLAVEAAARAASVKRR